jgi:hypothetical protein
VIVLRYCFSICLDKLANMMHMYLVTLFLLTILYTSLLFFFFFFLNSQSIINFHHVAHYSNIVPSIKLMHTLSGCFQSFQCFQECCFTFSNLLYFFWHIQMLIQDLVHTQDFTNHESILICYEVQ